MTRAPGSNTVAVAEHTIAMLLALQGRERSGRGDHIDAAMTDASLPLLLVSP